MGFLIPVTASVTTKRYLVFSASNLVRREVDAENLSFRFCSKLSARPALYSPTCRISTLPFNLTFTRHGRRGCRLAERALSRECEAVRYVYVLGFKPLYFEVYDGGPPSHDDLVGLLVILVVLTLLSQTQHPRNERVSGV